MAGDDSGGPALVIVCITFIALSVIVVSVRGYVRVAILKSVGVDDGLILVALICMLLQLTSVLIGVHHGLGQHIYHVSTAQSVKVYQMITLWELFYISSTTFVKASFGASLLRLTSSRIWRALLWFGMIIDFMIGTVIFFYVIFTCSPVEYQWTQLDPATPKGHCKPQKGLTILGYVFLAITCFVYLLFAILPIFILWNVQMAKSLKITVMGVLALGLIPMVATLARLKYIPGAVKGTDIMFTITNDLIWSVVECGTGMISACIATYRPLLKILQGRVKHVKGQYMEAMELDDIFFPGVKTTVVANKKLRSSVSEEDILGVNIVETVEVRVEERGDAPSQFSKGSMDQQVEVEEEK